MMNARSNAVNRIKETVSMLDVAQRYGLHITRGGFTSCPFHNEKTPSLKLYDRPGRGFYCYGCNTGGSVIDFVMLLLDLDFQSAILRLAVDFGIPVATGPLPRPEAIQAKAKQTAWSKQKQEYERLEARWRVLSSIRWELAPKHEYDPWPDEWCQAIAELPKLEFEMEMLEVEMRERA